VIDRLEERKENEEAGQKKVKGQQGWSDGKADTKWRIWQRKIRGNWEKYNEEKYGDHGVKFMKTGQNRIGWPSAPIQPPDFKRRKPPRNCTKVWGLTNSYCNQLKIVFRDVTPYDLAYTETYCYPLPWRWRQQFPPKVGKFLPNNTASHRRKTVLFTRKFVKLNNSYTQGY